MCLTVRRRLRDRPNSWLVIHNTHTHECYCNIQRARQRCCEHMLVQYSASWVTTLMVPDSRSTVAWPSTTVAWPFSDFFQKNFKMLETSEKRCLTVSRRSRDLRPLSRDRSVTFFKKFPNCLKRPKNFVWQSINGRVTSDHCRVTVQWLFQKNSKCLKRPRNVVWQSADGRVTSDHSRVTVQWLLSKIFPIAWNVQKTLFDSRLTVAWPPTTVAWPYSDFFQNIPNCLKRPKNLVW